MENKIKIFESEEFGKIRTVIINDEPWFIGKDAAKILGYAKPRNAIAAHVDSEDKKDALIQGDLGGMQKMTVINESGIYSLIMSSKLPKAKEFKRWVTTQILPTIRRTGGYVTNEDMFIENYLPFLDEPYRNLFRLQMMAINQLNERIRHDQPLVEFANQVSDTTNLIDMNAMAKLAVDENIPIGRNRLFRWLRENEILMSDNLPYQKYIDRGYFAVKETVFEVDSMTRTYQQTLVTGKGQRYVIGKLKKDFGEVT